MAPKTINKSTKVFFKGHIPGSSTQKGEFYGDLAPWIKLKTPSILNQHLKRKRCATILRQDFTCLRAKQNFFPENSLSTFTMSRSILSNSTESVNSLPCAEAKWNDRLMACHSTLQQRSFRTDARQVAAVSVLLNCAVYLIVYIFLLTSVVNLVAPISKNLASMIFGNIVCALLDQ